MGKTSSHNDGFGDRGGYKGQSITARNARNALLNRVQNRAPKLRVWLAREGTCGRKASQDRHGSGEGGRRFPNFVDQGHWHVAIKRRITCNREYGPLVF